MKVKKQARSAVALTLSQAGYALGMLLLVPLATVASGEG